MPDLRPLVWGGAAASLAGALHAAVNRRHLHHLAPAPSPVRQRVSVLVPARDEAATIGECVARLLAQRQLPDLQVVVLDDGSTDGTAQVARGAAAGDPRCTVVAGAGDPPRGWLGKPHACVQLARQATGDVLVFVDADVRLAPDAVAAAVRELRASGTDLLSAWPRQIPQGVLGRLVQPMQQWSWLTTLPLQVARQSPRPALAAANGQFLVVRAQAYHAAGGHSAVRSEVLDDIALARAFKRAGLRVDLADASAVASCRMYGSAAELVDGYAKSLWRAFGGPRRGLAVTAALVGVYVLPPAYALAGRHRWTRLAGAAGYGAAVAGRALCAGETGSRPWPDSFAHPVSVAVFAGLMVTSVTRHQRGSLRWRGRPVTTP